MKLTLETIKKYKWEQDSKRKSTLHRFFDFSESGQNISFEMFGIGLQHEFFIIKNGYITRYQTKEDWENFKQGLVKFFNNQISLKYAQAHMIPDSKKFIRWVAKNCNEATLQNLTNRELAKILIERHHRHQKLLAWQWFGFVGKYAIQEVLLSVLKKYSLPKNNLEIIFAHKKPIFIIEEKLNAKKLAYRIQQGKIKIGDREKFIAEHLRKFRHILIYDETNEPMTSTFLHKRLEKYLRNKNLGNNIKQEYLQLKMNKKAFYNLISHTKFSKRDLALITFSSNFAHFMELRNQFRAFSAIYSKPLFNIISNKLGLTIKDLLCFTDYEINSALLGVRTISSEEAKERYNYSLVISYNPLILTGKKAKSITNIISQKYDQSILTGQGATKGIICGKVRIVIDIQDLRKVKKGEILVASMTTPVFLLAIKKAAAIITDEGGMLCHAAVIARELNLPCVTGTKIATQVLKDGDLIKVDANQGIIQKITEK